MIAITNPPEFVQKAWKYLQKSWKYLREASRQVRLHPDQNTLRVLSPDALLSLRVDSGRTITAATFALLAFGAYCVLSLTSPDVHLLSDTPTIRLPFVETNVSFFAFLLLGPLLLTVLWMRLVVLIAYHQQLKVAIDTRQLTPTPTLSELNHPLFWTSRQFTLLFMYPFVMWHYSYKAMAVPGYGHVMFFVTLAAIWIQLVAVALLFISDSMRKRVVISLSLLVVASWGGAFWNSNEQFVRPYYLFQANLAGAFLQEEDLRGACLARANLSGAILIGADLTGADLRFANLNEADLSRATLEKARFHSAQLVGADLSRSCSNSSEFSRANLTGANLTGSTLISSDFSAATLNDANLSRADLSFTVFTETKLVRTNLAEAVLTSAILTQVDAAEAVFDYADFTKAELAYVNFDRASLQGTVLDGSTIVDSDFRNTTLRSVRFVNFNDAQAQAFFSRNTVSYSANLSDLQKVHLAMAKMEPKPIYDSRGDIAGYDDPRGAIHPWERLDPPDPNGVLVSRVRVRFTDLPFPISGTAASIDSFSDTDFNDEVDTGNFGDETFGQAATVKAELTAPARGSANLVQKLVANAQTDESFRKWLLTVLMRSNEAKSLRAEALFVLTHLENSDVARATYMALADLYPREPSIVEFHQTTIRKHLVLQALRSPHLTDTEVRNIVKKVYGTGVKWFLSHVRFETPHFGETLNSEEDKARESAVKRAEAIAKLVDQ